MPFGKLKSEFGFLNAIRVSEFGFLNAIQLSEFGFLNAIQLSEFGFLNAIRKAETESVSLFGFLNFVSAVTVTPLLFYAVGLWFTLFLCGFWRFCIRAVRVSE